MLTHDEMGGVHDENWKLAAVQEGPPGAPSGATGRPSKAVHRVGEQNISFVAYELIGAERIVRYSSRSDLEQARPIRGTHHQKRPAQDRS